MIIGFNETVKLIPNDYSDCASVMEAAVACMQECGFEERQLYMYINEAVNIKEAANKAISFIKSWLSKILGILQKVRRIIISKISKFKNYTVKEHVEFSIEDYDYNNKFTEIEIGKYDFLGNHTEYEGNYLADTLKKWTGKDDQKTCTVNDIKEYIHDTIGKTTITQDTKGYSFEDVKRYIGSSNDMDLINNIEKESKKFADIRMEIINEFAEKNKNSENIKEFNKDRIKETMKFASLNTNLITALISTVTEKVNLNMKIYSYYTKQNQDSEK